MASSCTTRRPVTRVPPTRNWRKPLWSPPRCARVRRLPIPLTFLALRVRVLLFRYGEPPGGGSLEHDGINEGRDVGHGAGLAPDYHRPRVRGGSGANGPHGQTLPSMPCRLQAPSTAFPTAGPARP